FLCYAGALRDVRRRAVIRPYSPPLLWRRRPQGRSGREWGKIFHLDNLPSPAGNLRRIGRSGGRGFAQAIFQGASLKRNTVSFRFSSFLRMIVSALTSPAEASIGAATGSHGFAQAGNRIHVSGSCAEQRAELFLYFGLCRFGGADNCA